MTRLHSAAFSFVLGALTPNLALAGPKQCDPKCPKHCEQRLAKEEPAAFSGHLLSPELAISLGLKADDCKVFTATEVEFAERKKDLDIGLLKDLRKNDEERHQQSLEAMRSDRDRWKEAAAVPFYREPWFVAIVTAVVVGAIFVGASQVPR